MLPYHRHIQRLALPLRAKQFSHRARWPVTTPRPLDPLSPVALQRRPFVVQRRFLLGHIFRAARSGIALTAGAAAGGVAYANHKLSEATSSVSDKFDKVTGWIGDKWDKLDLDAFSRANDGTTSGGSSANAGAGSSGAGAGGAGGSAGGAGSGGGKSGGGGDDAVAIGAVTGAISSDDDDRTNQEIFDDQINAMENQMINLTRKMIEVRNILLQVEGSDNVQIPSIVVIGSQSSGKSSVLEAIVGHEFLPKGSNMVTRRPIELTLVHVNRSEGEYCEFPTLRLGKMTSFRDVQKTLADLNRAVPPSEVISDDPIQLKIFSPHVPDLTMIDLPGYIQVVAADQPLELKSRIAALCEKYIQPPNIILAVSAADVDLANSTALRASRKMDPQGQRTIGVITKMDLVDAERGVATLLNREYPLKMGYVGVVTRAPHQSMAGSLFGGNENQTRIIADSERSFFGSAPEYKSVNWGVLRLREILTGVLERSMAEGLEPTRRQIQRELEETSYAFKVQYNDRTLTPQTYLAQCSDQFKVKFQGLAARFGRDQVRDLIKQSLDQKALDILAETYWNPPPGAMPRSIIAEWGGAGDAAAISEQQQPPLSDLSSAKPDMLAWQRKVDHCSAALTKLGVGRLSTSMLVKAIDDRMNELLATSPLGNSSLAREQIREAQEGILSAKFYSTADQIENSIKPYKYEIEIDAREWQQSREYSFKLLSEELRQCKDAYTVLENEVGSSKLSKLVRSLNSMSPTENLDHFSASLLTKARTAAFLKERMEILQARSVFMRSTKCKSSKNRALCPEIFMDVVSNKLAATSVLFLNFELLSDFYYSFPREFDARMQSLSEDQVETMATQDPGVKRHIELQHRKELLQLSLSKLQAISDLRSMEDTQQLPRRASRL